MSIPSQDSFTKYIPQKWMQHNLQTYVFITRLKNDTQFRNDWIQRRVQKEDIQNPKAEEDLLRTFIEDLDLISAINAAGKPVIRIIPRRFHRRSCQSLLDINLKHTTTCVSLLIDESAEHIIHGYGIVQVLGSLFGEDYKKMVTQYVIKRMNDELGLKNGR
jgi:hypothetical protein